MASKVSVEQIWDRVERIKLQINAIISDTVRLQMEFRSLDTPDEDLGCFDELDNIRETFGDADFNKRIVNLLKKGNGNDYAINMSKAINMVGLHECPSFLLMQIVPPSCLDSFFPTIPVQNAEVDIMKVVSEAVGMIECLHSSSVKYIDIQVFQSIMDDLDSILNSVFGDGDYPMDCHTDVYVYCYSDFIRASTFISRYRSFECFGHLKRSFMNRVKEILRTRISSKQKVRPGIRNFMKNIVSHSEIVEEEAVVDDVEDTKVIKVNDSGNDCRILSYDENKHHEDIKCGVPNRKGEKRDRGDDVDGSDSGNTSDSEFSDVTLTPYDIHKKTTRYKKQTEKARLKRHKKNL